MNTLFNDIDNGAEFSKCGKYRYQLWRIWDKTKPLAMFIMLNPSKADANENDNTIRRCISFANSWKLGGIYVGNLYAYCSTDPSNLKRVSDPKGKDNLFHLKEMIRKCEVVVCAWGNNILEKQGELMKPLEGIKMKDLSYLELTNSGNPKHPLYLKKELKPRPLMSHKTIET